MENKEASQTRKGIEREIRKVQRENYGFQKRTNEGNFPLIRPEGRAGRWGVLCGLGRGRDWGGRGVGWLGWAFQVERGAWRAGQDLSKLNPAHPHFVPLETIKNLPRPYPEPFESFKLLKLLKPCPPSLKVSIVSKFSKGTG